MTGDVQSSAYAAGRTGEFRPTGCPVEGCGQVLPGIFSTRKLGEVFRCYNETKKHYLEVFINEDKKVDLRRATEDQRMEAEEQEAQAAELAKAEAEEAERLKDQAEEDEFMRQAAAARARLEAERARIAADPEDQEEAERAEAEAEEGRRIVAEAVKAQRELIAAQDAQAKRDNPQPAEPKSSTKEDLAAVLQNVEEARAGMEEAKAVAEQVQRRRSDSGTPRRPTRQTSKKQRRPSGQSSGRNRILSDTPEGGTPRAPTGRPSEKKQRPTGRASGRHRRTDETKPGSGKQRRPTGRASGRHRVQSEVSPPVDPGSGTDSNEAPTIAWDKATRDQHSTENIKIEVKAGLTSKLAAAAFHGDLIREMIKNNRKVGDRFVLVEPPLGQGSFSIVAKAKDLITGEFVAVKFLEKYDPETDQAGLDENADRVRRGWKIQSLVDHESSARIIGDALFEDKVLGPIHVEEFIDGTTLTESVRKGVFAEEVVRMMIVQFCGVLIQLEALHVVHRDIKPLNTMIESDAKGYPKRIKLTDFGIAKRGGDKRDHQSVMGDGMAKLKKDKDLSDSDRQEISTQLTKEGIIVGTPHLIAPEQLTGGGLGPRTDMYSAAATFFFALTGQNVYPGTQVEAMQAKVMGRPPRSVRLVAMEQGIHVSVALDRALTKALQPDPEMRFKTPLDFSDAITGVQLAESYWIQVPHWLPEWLGDLLVKMGWAQKGRMAT